MNHGKEQDYETLPGPRPQASAVKNTLLIPVRRFTRLPGQFAWPEHITVSVESGLDRRPIQKLGPSVRIVRNDSRAILHVRRDPHQTAVDAYRITIAPTNIELLAATDPGIAYAVYTLLDLMRVHGRALPCCRIEDRPDVARRSVYLDCSRGKVPTVATVKRLIERFASWKLNELQLYIENVFTFASHPNIGRGFSPFTPDDILDIQAHCRRYHIRLVPSLSSFGHMERILTLPAYQHLGEKPGYRGFPGGTTLCPGDSGSRRLMADLYADFLPLFDAEDFNVCCDEPWELGQGRSRRRVRQRGVGHVYLDFIRKLHRLCEHHGKRMNLWADIVLHHPTLIPKLPDNMVLLNWDYEPSATRLRRTREITDHGLACMVCPGTHGWNSHGTRVADSLENVARAAREGRRCGADGLMITEWGDFGHRNPIGVSLHAMAHAAAQAWNGRAVTNFTRTFCEYVLHGPAGHLPQILDRLGATEACAGTNLYHALVEPLTQGKDFFRRLSRNAPARVFPGYRPGRFDTADLNGCRRVISSLRNADKWLSMIPTGNQLARLVIEDLVLAARMDRLACQRVLAAREDQGDLLAIARDTQALAKEFERNWKRRYRPSRLNDNLRLFAAAATECERLAGK